MRANEVLVKVEAVSINRGEMHRLDSATAGWRPGWDFAGVVIELGANVQGLEIGDQVVGLLPGAAWSTYVAAPAQHVARHTLSAMEAAALPVAGVTALRVLRMFNRPLTGAAVAVLGAAGGVGRFAIQMASRGGATVTGVVRDTIRADGLTGLGAANVTKLDELRGPFDLVLESVGGSVLAQMLGLLDNDGMLITFGNSSRQPTTFDTSDFYPKQGNIRGYHLLEDLRSHPPQHDLHQLVDLVAVGTLHVAVDLVVPWEHFETALSRLRHRQLAGKAVMTVGGD